MILTSRASAHCVSARIGSADGNSSGSPTLPQVRPHTPGAASALHCDRGLGRGIAFVNGGPGKIKSRAGGDHRIGSSAARRSASGQLAMKIRMASALRSVMTDRENEFISLPRFIAPASDL